MNNERKRRIEKMAVEPVRNCVKPKVIERRFSDGSRRRKDTPFANQMIRTRRNVLHDAEDVFEAFRYAWYEERWENADKELFKDRLEYMSYVLSSFLDHKYIMEMYAELSERGVTVGIEGRHIDRRAKLTYPIKPQVLKQAMEYLCACSD